MIRVGLLGLSRREGTFSEVGLRSWEEAGCAAVERVLQSAGQGIFGVHRPLVVHSSRSEVEKILRDWCEAPNVTSRCELILTVGGTGLTSADIMPEAASALIQRVIPGIPELLRRIGYDCGYVPAYLSRAVAGTRGMSVIINLPGDAKGIADEASLTAMTTALLPHLPGLVSAAQE
jgi:molybdopterin adenylyltransferase